MIRSAPWILCLVMIALCASILPGTQADDRGADGILSFDATGDTAPDFLACGTNGAGLVLARPAVRPTHGSAFASFHTPLPAVQVRPVFPPEPVTLVGRYLPLAVTVVEWLL